MTIKIQSLLLVFLALLAIASGRQARPGFFYSRARGRCTAQYWSRRMDSWPKMVPRKSTVSNVFGSVVFQRYRENLTLLEAAAAGGEGAFGKLLKQSTAALLNSYARKGYPYASWEVKTLLIRALVSERAAALQAREFLEANEECA